jgi:hypothetical protein
MDLQTPNCALGLDVSMNDKLKFNGSKKTLRIHYLLGTAKGTIPSPLGTAQGMIHSTLTTTKGITHSLLGMAKGTISSPLGIAQGMTHSTLTTTKGITHSLLGLTKRMTILSRTQPKVPFSLEHD